ncbi:MAG: hypothetical protein GQ570_10805 [Helicobacteraceae bacterium]|nr:hypothetical protein [Helicobacteraceae bacterium]
MEAKVATQENKVSAEDLFKDYVAEVVEYDPEIDGGDEHLIRDDHLDKKEEIVLSVVEKLKNKQRATRGTRG